MPFIFNWHDSEHSIVRVDVFGDINWEQFHISVDRVAEELIQADHRIDLIYNDPVGMPKGNPLPHLKVSSSKLDPLRNFGILVLVSPRTLSGFTKSMIEIAIRVYGLDLSHNGGFVTTMDEAVAIINKSRAKDRVPVAARRS